MKIKEQKYQPLDIEGASEFLEWSMSCRETHGIDQGCVGNFNRKNIPRNIWRITSWSAPRVGSTASRFVEAEDWETTLADSDGFIVRLASQFETPQRGGGVGHQLR